MKFGTETGSLVNHFLSTSNSASPEVGMGATIMYWSDRSPATVIEVFKAGKFEYVTLQYDNYKRTDNLGMSDVQHYEYSANPDGATVTFRKEDNAWVCVYKDAFTGRWKKSKGPSLLIGSREKYHDFSF